MRKMITSHNDIMAKSAHPHPHLDVTMARNWTTTWSGLIEYYHNKLHFIYVIACQSINFQNHS